MPLIHKNVSFSFMGHKRVHTKAQYPQKRDASDTCCFYLNSTFCSSLLIWMLHKDTLDDSLLPFCSCAQPKGRTKLWFISCVTSCSIVSYRCSVARFGLWAAIQVWFGWLLKNFHTPVELKTKMIIRFPAFVLRCSQHLHFLNFAYSLTFWWLFCSEWRWPIETITCSFPNKRELIGCCRKQRIDAVEFASKSRVSISDEHGWVANSESRTS